MRLRTGGLPGFALDHLQQVPWHAPPRLFEDGVRSARDLDRGVGAGPGRGFTGPLAAIDHDAPSPRQARRDRRPTALAAHERAAARDRRE